MLNPLIQVNPWDIDARLVSLGLTRFILEETIKAAHLAFASCTPNDAPFVPGFDAWAKGLRKFRDQVCPLGWRKLDPGNFSITSNDVHEINVVIASGDEETGQYHKNKTPQTKSIKGLFTELAAHKNAVSQGSLFTGFDLEKARKAERLLKYETWVFLIYVTEENYRAELSYPDSHQSGDKLKDWRERILLPHYSATPTPIYRPIEDEGQDFEIEIRRKQ